MQSLAAGRFQERRQPKFLEQQSHLFGCRDDSGPTDGFVGQIENEPVRLFDLIGPRLRWISSTLICTSDTSPRHAE
jgi:hypothetical protein